MQNARKISFVLRTFALLIVIALLFTTCSSVNEKGKESGKESSKGDAKVTSGATVSSVTTTEADTYYNTPGTLPIVKENITLRIAVPQDPVIEDWETNELSLELEKVSNITLEFLDYPKAEYQTKVDLIMASGDEMPDIFLGQKMPVSTLTNWGKAGKIIPLNEYFDKLAYWLPLVYEDCLTTFDECLDKIRSYDGNIYGLPSYLEALSDSIAGGRIVMYKPWLDTLGKDFPATIDELYDVLVAFRDGDPNGNNIKDEIPMTGYRDSIYFRYFFMSPFVYQNKEYWTIDNDGKIGVSFTTEEWREGLRYIKRLIDENLLDPLSFTQDHAQMTATISADPPTIGSYLRQSTSNLSANDQKRYEYYPIYAPAGPDGVRIIPYFPPAPSVLYIISSSCKYPEAAFMLGDLLGGEKFSIINRFGFEGKDWVKPDENDICVWEDYGYEKRIKIVNQSWGKLQNVWWANLGVSTLPASIMHGTTVADPSNQQAVSSSKLNARLVMEVSNNYVDESKVVQDLIYNEEEDECIATKYSPIKTYVNECLTRFVLGDMDIEKDWNEYINTLKKMGLDDCIAATQSCYDRMFKK